MVTNYSTLDTVLNTLIPLSRELWPMIDSVMPSCCSRMTTAMELVTRYSTPDSIVEVGTMSATCGIKGRLHGGERSVR